MKPTADTIFAKETGKTDRELKKNDLEIVNSSPPQNFEVTAVGENITLVKPGNIVWFAHAETFKDNDGETIYAFDESELKGIK